MNPSDVESTFLSREEMNRQLNAKWGYNIDYIQRGISIFDIEYARLTSFDIKFASLSKYDTGRANSFKTRDFGSFSQFHDFC